MCASCMTSAEALVINSGGVAAAAWYGLRSLRRRPEVREARRLRVEESNRQFALSLGLDPSAVGAAPPVAPTRV